ncbi:MAG: AMP-binding protein, partial [Rubrivivax sp.]
MAQRHPEREAVVDAPNRVQLTDGQPRRLSYAQLATEVDRLAVRLWRLGLQCDDIVVVQLVNSVEQYVVYLACLRLGLIISPVPVQYREHELAQILAQTQARAVITATRVLRHPAAAMWVALARQHACLAHVLAFGQELPAGALSLEDVRAKASGTPAS